MVRSGIVLSVGYQLIGMVIRIICEVNTIKDRESISHLPGLYTVGVHLANSKIIQHDQKAVIFSNFKPAWLLDIIPLFNLQCLWNLSPRSPIAKKFRILYNAPRIHPSCSMHVCL